MHALFSFQTGIAQQYANGQYFRKKYDGFINQTYHHNQVFNYRPGGVVDTPRAGTHPHRQTPPRQTPPMAPKAGGTHPTGMHSCFNVFCMSKMRKFSLSVRNMLCYICHIIVRARLAKVMKRNICRILKRSCRK